MLITFACTHIQTHKHMQPCVIYMAPPGANEDAPFINSPTGTHVRLHDQCFTSETLGSLRCDCASQLAAALAHISTRSGAVVYMMQEGRGIGLANKVSRFLLGILTKYNKSL